PGPGDDAGHRRAVVVAVAGVGAAELTGDVHAGGDVHLAQLGLLGVQPAVDHADPDARAVGDRPDVLHAEPLELPRFAGRLGSPDLDLAVVRVGQGRRGGPDGRRVQEGQGGPAPRCRCAPGVATHDTTSLAARPAPPPTG